MSVPAQGPPAGIGGAGLFSLIAATDCLSIHVLRRNTRSVFTAISKDILADFLCRRRNRVSRLGGGGLPTFYQGAFCAVMDALKVVPVLSIAQATLRSRSATDRSARP